MSSAKKSSKVLLIVNPQAGKMKSKIGMFDIINMLNSLGYIVTVHCTSGPKDATSAVINQADGHDMIVCCGGDGTLNEVVSGIIKSGTDIPIGYIPAGSTNDFARTLNLPLKFKKAIKIIPYGVPKPVDIGKLNEEIYFSYVASFGAFTKISYKTPQKLKNIFGHFAYIMGGIKHLNEIHSYNVGIKTETFSINGEFIFCAISNTTSIGGILNFNKEDVSLNDGQFEVLLIKQPKNSLDLSDIIHDLIHKKYDARHVFFFRTKQIEFTFDSPASWTVDGEFGGRHTYVKIENINNAVKIITEQET